MRRNCFLPFHLCIRRFNVHTTPSQRCIDAETALWTYRVVANKPTSENLAAMEVLMLEWWLFFVGSMTEPLLSTEPVTTPEVVGEDEGVLSITDRPVGVDSECLTCSMFSAPSPAVLGPNRWPGSGVVRPELWTEDMLLMLVVVLVVETWCCIVDEAATIEGARECWWSRE